MYFYCCNDFVWSYWGLFFILRLTYILWQCAYIWHRPLGFTMTRDFGFLCIKIGFFVWNPLFTQVVTILSHACDEIHKRPWYVCAFSAELVHISVEKISEYHTLMDKPNLTLLYNGSCVPSVTFLKTYFVHFIPVLYLVHSNALMVICCVSSSLLSD